MANPVTKFVGSLHVKVVAGLLGGAVASCVVALLNAVDVSHAQPGVAAAIGVISTVAAAYAKKSEE